MSHTKRENQTFSYAFENVTVPDVKKGYKGGKEFSMDLIEKGYDEIMKKANEIWNCPLDPKVLLHNKIHLSNRIFETFDMILSEIDNKVNLYNSKHGISELFYLCKYLL